MAKVNPGDAVVIAAREQTQQDVKSGLYYAHYAGLRGTILKIYGDEVSVSVDRDSLPTDIRARHEESEKAMRQNWLDKLSEDARGRLTEGDKQFRLSYAVLVSLQDLAPDKGAARRAASAASDAPAAKPTAEERRDARAVAQSIRSIDPLSGESDIGRARRSPDAPSESGADSPARRLSAADLDSREAAHLAERERRKGE